MKIIILGSSGQVGKELVACAEQAGIDYLAYAHADLDVTDSTALQDCLDGASEISFVINATAYTAVDKAESDVDTAHNVNVDAVANMASWCHEHATPLMHISTDYVFDGTATTPYKESDQTSPAGVYGQTKLEGEQALTRIHDKYIILRTAWVYGVQGKNFVKTMLRLAKQHRQIKVVSDQVGCPTSAVQIAGVIIEIVQAMHATPNDRWGTYHFCSAGSTNWAGFARAIFTQARQAQADFPEVDVVPISTSDYPTAARRPMYSVLNCSKIERDFGIRPDTWQAMLAHEIPNILKNIDK